MKRYSNWVLAAAAVLLAVTGLATRPLKAQTALSADGVIESTSGGLMFPDGSVQASAAVASSAPVEDTGIDSTQCFDETGATRNCAGTGEDGEHQAGVTRLKKVNGKTVTVKAKVENPSPVATGAFDVALFLLDDTTTDGAEPVVTRSLGSLLAHRNRAVTLKHTSDQDVTGKLAVVVVDSGAAVREREEDNNVTWERLD